MASEQQSGIDDEITPFVHGIDALQSTFPMTILVTSAIYAACGTDYETFKTKNADRDPNGNFIFEPQHFHELKQLAARVNKAAAANIVLPQTFITAIVSQYDAFLGGLLRRLYKIKPELLKQSEKKLSYAQLCAFGNLEGAKDSILEKEVEDLLRMSHADQFISMEKDFGLPLRKELHIWPVFIELTERRNLFAHCDGKVSAQYLSVCDAHDVDFGESRPCIGQKLDVTSSYFSKAHACIFEIGVKLAHVLWRKIIPGEIKTADSNLVNLTYDLLVDAKYALAIIMCSFGLEILKRHSSDAIKRALVINLAQAYKWNNQPDACIKTLNDQDWSSCSLVFKMAVAILKDEFVKASSMMQAAATSEPITTADYRHWPLFNEFRKSTFFVDEYRRVYGHDPVPVEKRGADVFFNPALSAIDVGVGPSLMMQIKKNEAPQDGPDGKSQQEGTRSD